MRRQSSLKRADVASRDDDVGRADPAEGMQRAQEEHILLDVWSIKQGALRLQTRPFAVVLIFILGSYFCVGAILNYNEIDADQVADPPIALPACNVQAPSPVALIRQHAQRDMITNMRVMLPGRMAAHQVIKSRHIAPPPYPAPPHPAPCPVPPDLPENTQVSRTKCKPEAVAVHTDSVSITSVLETQSKTRERLSDPRLLGYTEIVHPMVMMRQRFKGDFMDKIDWDYYTAKLPPIRLPPFRWDASLFLNMTFKIDPADILQATQMFNSWPPAARPKLSYNLRANDNNVQVWIVQASLGANVRAYRISVPDIAGVVTVEHIKKVVLETSYDAMDVPATEVQTDVAAADYKNGQPDFKKIMIERGSDAKNTSAPSPREKLQVSCEQYFDLDKRCRQTIYVPRIHKVSAVEHVEV
jgi:hypothetical protein